MDAVESRYQSGSDLADFVRTIALRLVIWAFKVCFNVGFSCLTEGGTVRPTSTQPTRDNCAVLKGCILFRLLCCSFVADCEG